MAVAVLAQRGVDAVGGGAQRELAQRDQVALAEEAFGRLARLLRHVHLAFGEAFEQFVRRQVDQFDVVGFGENLVGHGLAHLHAGDLRDHVVEAFQVLDVDGRIDVDARFEQFLHVLPALGMARAGMVAVRQLVDQQQLRPAGEGGVEIEFGQLQSAVFQRQRRQEFEPVEQGFGFRAAVKFDVADDDVGTVVALAPRRLEHRVALADAGGGAEEDLQAAAPCARILVLHAREQGVGIGTFGVLGRGHATALWTASIMRQAVPGWLCFLRCG